MTSTELEKLTRDELTNVGLWRVVDRHKSQFLEFPDGVFAEVVLADGSKLEDAEGVLRALRENLRKQGIELDAIVRASWTVENIGDPRPSIDISGDIRLATVFQVRLVSGGATADVDVVMDPPVVLGIRRKLLSASAKSLDEIAVMK